MQTCKKVESSRCSALVNLLLLNFCKEIIYGYSYIVGLRTTTKNAYYLVYLLECSCLQTLFVVWNELYPPFTSCLFAFCTFLTLTHLHAGFIYSFLFHHPLNAIQANICNRLILLTFTSRNEKLFVYDTFNHSFNVTLTCTTHIEQCFFTTHDNATGFDNLEQRRFPRKWVFTCPNVLLAIILPVHAIYMLSTNTGGPLEVFWVFYPSSKKNNIHVHGFLTTITLSYKDERYNDIIAASKNMNSNELYKKMKQNKTQ